MITRFRGDYAFLSNFYKTDVLYAGQKFPSAEHAYQSAKSADPAYKLALTNPHLSSTDAKVAGRRPGRDVITAKFGHYTDMGDRLISTGDEVLIEGNDHGDSFWGVIEMASNGRGGFGENWLGRLLMLRRWELVSMRSQLPV